MQRCSSSDCGDASLDASVVVSSICDERLGQMWYNETSMIRSRLTDECLTICGISAAEASDSEDNSSLAAICLGKGSDYYNVETRTCTGAANQLWEWITTTVGSVLFNVETNQAVTVCSDLEPWCGFLLLLGFDATWSARRLTGVQLPGNMSAITEFQTFSTAALTKAQASSLGLCPSSSSHAVVIQKMHFSDYPCASSDCLLALEQFIQMHLCACIMCFAYHSVLKCCPVQMPLLVPCIIVHSCACELHVYCSAYAVHPPGEYI
jgi:hypothetical protein